jgi:hypothetical protein
MGRDNSQLDALPGSPYQAIIHPDFDQRHAGEFRRRSGLHPAFGGPTVDCRRPQNLTEPGALGLHRSVTSGRDPGPGAWTFG